MTKWNESAAAAKWIPELEAAEDRHGIPRGILARQCYQESRFNPLARNPSGAVGLMQLIPKYFPGAGRDPLADIETAAKYLSQLHKGFADWQLSLAAYDWGPGNVRAALAANRNFSTWPNETQNYVSQIINDVPVEGSLCKTQIQTAPAGAPQTPPSVGASSVGPSAKSWWQSVTKYFTRASSQNSQAQLPPSALPQPGTSSQTAGAGKWMSRAEFDRLSTGVVSMSTPNPFLTAAAPELIAVLQAILAFNTNIGPDPTKWRLTVGPALTVLAGTAGLQLPQLAAAEAGAVQAQFNSTVSGWISKLQSSATPKA